MATTKSPGRKTRPTNYHNIGVEGRVTGVKVAPRPRDEHGLEEMEGLFSPTPGKPSSLKNVMRLRNGTSQSSEPMEIAESSAPEPTTVLANRVQQSASRQFVPHSRSPLKKTNIGPPKRGSSIGALSPIRPQSSARNQSQSPFRARKLDFSSAEGRQSAYSVSRNSALPNGLTNFSPSRPPPRNVYDMPRSSPEKGATPPPIGIGEEDDISFPNGMPDDDDDAYEAHQRQSDVGHNANQQLADEEAAAAAIAKITSPKRRGHGRPARITRSSDAHVANEDVAEIGAQEEAPAPELEQETELVEPLKKKRGRPARADKKGALQPKDENQAVKSRPYKSAPKPYEAPQTTHQWQRMTHQTPMEEDGVSHTRSGRNVYQPLQFWKGERAIFESSVRDPALQEIIRVEDATPVKRHKRYGGGTKSKKRKRNIFEDDIEDDEQEPWETADGIIRAPVQLWDAVLGVSVQNEEEELPIAFSSARIQPRASPDNPSFLFTKCLTTPFFGSGMIELPPMGSKNMKNSRKFHFMFFVSSGKVAVDVAGTRFVISKGGMWQVPRGNFYSIANENDTHSARIFFAQGCEPMVELREPPSLADLKQ